MVNEVMVMANNEGKACDAVVRLLERRTGETRAGTRRPEIDGVGPRVDLRLKLGTQDYALEHTQIEAFAGQTRTGEEFGQFITPVTEQLSGTLPGPAVYDLYFPIDARLGVKAKELERLRNDFIGWVRAHAQRLHEMNPDTPTREENPRGFNDQYRAIPPGFPYEITLQREAHWSHSGRHDGVLLAARIAPEDVEDSRETRLRQTLDRKCPKLQRCRQEGVRTVLVLEDGDIALTNYALVGEQLAGLLEERADVPDEIYLVETALDRWEVRPMKCDDECWPIEGWTEFNADDLTDLTEDRQNDSESQSILAKK